MTGRILTPIAGAAYNQDILDYYGAIEIDSDTGEVVWVFDAIENGLTPPNIEHNKEGLTHKGFRPASVQRINNGDTIISGWKRVLRVSDDGTIKKTYTHDRLNDVHETQYVTDIYKKPRYLIASTGADQILEYDDDFNLIWKWNIWEHVDSSELPDDYYPSKNVGLDIRTDVFRTQHRLHVNYATYIDEERILASALNYGAFIIDRTTGEILTEFKTETAHNPMRLGSEILVTVKHGVRIFSIEGEHIIQHNLVSDGFLKDCDWIEERNVWLVTNAAANKIYLMTPRFEACIREYEVAEKAKMYESDWLSGSR